MYKCLDCGHIFDEGEQINWEDGHGFDTPPFEKWSTCPKCRRGLYEETVRCVVCCSEHLESEMNNNVCDECIDSYRNNFDACYNISKKTEDIEIEINSLLACLFEVNEIEAILIEHIKKNNPKIDCSEFIDADMFWFSSKIKEEVKNK